MKCGKPILARKHSKIAERGPALDYLDVLSAPEEQREDRRKQTLQSHARQHGVEAHRPSELVKAETVETHKARTMEKLNLRSRAELVRHAFDRGWLQHR